MIGQSVNVQSTPLCSTRTLTWQVHCGYRGWGTGALNLQARESSRWQQVFDNILGTMLL